MKKIIEARDLHRIADEIIHNVTMLGYTDPEDAEDDLDFYLPCIEQAARDIKGIADASKPAQ